MVGFQGEFLHTENLEEARLLVIGGQGFMPVEGAKQDGTFGSSVSRIPLYRGGEHGKGCEYDCGSDRCGTFQNRAASSLRCGL